ncbi:MAG TPA: hypothetical protein VGC76_15560 [Pyrinomonadaceae bacterium]
MAKSKTTTNTNAWQHDKQHGVSAGTEHSDQNHTSESHKNEKHGHDKGDDKSKKAAKRQ